MNVAKNAAGGTNSSLAGVIRLGALVVGALILGQLSMWLSGAWAGHMAASVSTLSPPPYVMGIVWSVIFALFGGAYYMLISQPIYTIRSKKLRNIAALVLILTFMLVLMHPFLVYRTSAYMLGFVINSLILALGSGFCILGTRTSPGATLLILPALAWLIFETYLTLTLTLYNF